MAVELAHYRGFPPPVVGEHLRFRGSVVHFGSEPPNHRKKQAVVVAGSSVAKHHAKLFWSQDSFWLVNLCGLPCTVLKASGRTVYLTVTDPATRVREREGFQIGDSTFLVRRLVPPKGVAPVLAPARDAALAASLRRQMEPVMLPERYTPVDPVVWQAVLRFSTELQKYVIVDEMWRQTVDRLAAGLAQRWSETRPARLFALGIVRESRAKSLKLVFTQESPRLRRPSGTPPDFASATGLGESLPATLANLCSQQAEPHFFRFVPRGEEDEVCLLAGRVSPEGSDAGTLAVGAQWRTPGGRFPEADDRYFFAHLLSDLSLSLTFLAQHKQALEFERVHSLGSITLGMAHDETHLISLVEPLVTQIGEFITKQCVACPRNPGQLARPLGKIRAVAAQVHGIARATLGFARQKGRPQITDCRRDVQTWFANIRDILSDDVLEITHCFDLSDRPFYADGRLVLAALRNLQVNSVASLNRSKHRCYQLDFEATDHPSDGKEPEYAVLRVADSGSGIPEAIAANIFQGRIEDSGTGHGLGTQIVRWVVDQHRALIRFATRPECGTVVELWFPRLDSPNPRKRQWARYETARQRLGVVRRLEHHPWFDHLASIASESMDRPAVEVQ